MPVRLAGATKKYVPKMNQILLWTVTSREHTNLTYDLTNKSLSYLASTLAVVTGASAGQMTEYISEPFNDRELQEFVRRISAARNDQTVDLECRFGRRLGWYALVRHLKPKLVVETGVDKGLGSVLLCSALLKNRAEGHSGEYQGTDINPRAGFLLQQPYSSVGRILYGDSIQSLQRIDQKIDIFINDSDHSAEYEYQEYLTVQNKLSENAIILGDNSHVTDKLLNFSRESGRDFVFFQEEPLNHWVFPAGIGISFRRFAST